MAALGFGIGKAGELSDDKAAAITGVTRIAGVDMRVRSREHQSSLVKQMLHAFKMRTSRRNPFWQAVGTINSGNCVQHLVFLWCSIAEPDALDQGEDQCHPRQAEQFEIYPYGFGKPVGDVNIRSPR